MKLICTKENKWVRKGRVYDVVKSDETCHYIEVSLPAIRFVREKPAIELADVRKDDLKFYCGSPTGTAEFEVYSKEVAQ